MSTEVAEVIFDKVKALPAEQQTQVLEFVERLADDSQTEAIEANEGRPIWEVIAEISSQVPDEEWDQLPADGSLNHDHYLYGGPKKG
ncbi:MAG: hypothetical protein ACR2GW_10880 [Pyrinomonadaceae bacterium]|jgi:type I restriction enzyme S subunit|nr:hypothetical protein [Pyrinomonadaceae bacterium]MDQ3585437.1 hypothetical protein [Acidobacteriota bacterium]